MKQTILVTLFDTKKAQKAGNGMNKELRNYDKEHKMDYSGGPFKREKKYHNSVTGMQGKREEGF